MVRAAAKVAYLVQLLLTETNDRSTYTDPEQVKDLVIEGEAFRKLQKLKKADPEAFFTGIMRCNCNPQTWPGSFGP